MHPSTTQRSRLTRQKGGPCGRGRGPHRQVWNDASPPPAPRPSISEYARPPTRDASTTQLRKKLTNRLCSALPRSPVPDTSHGGGSVPQMREHPPASPALPLYPPSRDRDRARACRTARSESHRGGGPSSQATGPVEDKLPGRSALRSACSCRCAARGVGTGGGGGGHGRARDGGRCSNLLRRFAAIPKANAFGLAVAEAGLDARLGFR